MTSLDYLLIGGHLLIDIIKQKKSDGAFKTNEILLPTFLIKHLELLLLSK